jgi:FixJ family two-component response regulator
MSDEDVSNIYVALVDDDQNLCRSFSRLLRAAGFHAVTYSSGEMFLADASRPRFDCLILDIQLTGISGLELHRQLTSLGSKTPVIYLTANADPEIRKQAMANVCAGYFYKTDAGEIVIEAIRKAVVDLRKMS